MKLFKTKNNIIKYIYQGNIFTNKEEVRDFLINKCGNTKNAAKVFIENYLDKIPITTIKKEIIEDIKKYKDIGVNKLSKILDN